MLQPSKMYITTAIDYTNATPHLGHAYQKVAADIQARFWRLKGVETFLLTGTDEHGLKVQKAAAAAGVSPKQFVDSLSSHFKSAWDVLKIKYSRFIRTTDPDHEARVLKFVERAKHDLYKGTYKGLYCTGCEAILTSKDIEDNKCKIHKRQLESVREETYFFKLSRYQDRLLKYYEENPDFILPKYRRNEVINRVEEGLKDISITRTSVTWGIPFPLEKGHYIYVWFDALLNYLTALGWPDGENFKKFWPTDYHHLGKDNLWFHAVIFPAMLMSADLPLPKHIFVNGWITVDGQKMSKSLGNVLDPRELCSQYGSDSVRYYLMREAPYGEDLDFRKSNLITRHNTELADELGNLVQRTFVLLEKKSDGVVPDVSDPEVFKLDIIQEIESHMEKLEFSEALAKIWEIIAAANKYVNDNKPWAISNVEDLSRILYNLVECIRIISVLLYPFMPSTSEKIFERLSIDPTRVRWGDAKKWGILSPGTKLKGGEMLFAKIKG